MRVLVTGAAGVIGRELVPRLARPGRAVRLLDRLPVKGDDVMTGDLTDLDTMLAATSDVDVVVHLGGLASEASWDEILHTNVHGTYCVLEAARRNGVGKVALASSLHAVGFRPWRDVDELPVDVSPRPDTFYGWSKSAIESLASLYADRFGMTVVAMRLGTCYPSPTSERALSTWLSPDDMARLVEAIIATEQTGAHVVWGVSDNAQRWWSLDEGRRIGFQPRDDAADHAHGDLRSADSPWIGAGFCTWPLGQPGQR